MLKNILYKVLVNKLKVLFYFSLFILYVLKSPAFLAQDSIGNKLFKDSIAKKHFSFEGQLYPNFNSDNYRPQFKLRLHLNGKTSIRFNSSFQRNVSNVKVLESSGGGGLGYVEKISSLYNVSIGLERNKNFNNAKLYSGFEGVLGFGRNNEYGSRTDSITYVADYDYNIIRPVQQIGLRLFSGFDYHLTNQIYLGMEVGLILLKTTHKTGSYQILDSSSLTDPDVTTPIAEYSSSILSFNGIGVLRVGWKF